MIGNKIGRLSILELPVDGKVRCLCECGKECLISARGLFSKNQLNLADVYRKKKQVNVSMNQNKVINAIC